MTRLGGVGAGGPSGLAAYAAIVTEPRYARSLVSTMALAAAVTVTTLAISGGAGGGPPRDTLSRPERGGRDAHLPARLSRRGRGLHGHHAGGAPGTDRRCVAAPDWSEARLRLLDGRALSRLPLLLDPPRDPHHHGRGGEARRGAGRGGALPR